jgi:hypothetical protein
MSQARKAMIEMTQKIASSGKMAPDSILPIEQNLRELPKPGRPPPDSLRTKWGDTLSALPRSSVSVMAVLDNSGNLTQLCTAGDLLRWCKAAWRAELD